MERHGVRWKSILTQRHDFIGSFLRRSNNGLILIHMMPGRGSLGSMSVLIPYGGTGLRISWRLFGTRSDD